MNNPYIVNTKMNDLYYWAFRSKVALSFNPHGRQQIEGYTLLKIDNLIGDCISGPSSMAILEFTYGL
jgi:hypothetical protein